MIENCIEGFAEIILDAIKVKLREQFGEDYSISTIYRAVLQIGITLKAVGRF